ncbi:3-oxoacyl-ACP synthase [Paradesulfitobacterium ferrireducens]|uniref:3-oxoacyl-ACP synthase n=1 Tax=Paradesulfitobacterium ferrireducens TaxID=2816476 RepID=UPI001A8D411C|nr:3-oxoacyl-ACP synthase [Paradesulfitobacterium ferrireducens]
MAKIITKVPIGIRNIGVYYPDTIITSSEIAERSGIPEDVIRDKFGIESKRKAAPEDTVSEMCVKAARACIRDIIEPEEVDLLIYHGSEYRDYYVYNCSAQIQHKLGAVNAKSFELHNLCSSGPLALQLAKSLMLVHPEIKNALLVVGTRESDLIDYQNERARFMFNFADGAAACLLQRNYECNEVLETEMITDGSFATDVAVYAVGNVSYPQNLRIEQDFGRYETEKARGSKVSYYGLDVLDPVSMKDRLDAVSLTNFVKVIRGAAEKSGYSPGEIKFLAPIFMKSSILDYILKQFDMTPEQSFILKNFGHVQSADAYISLYEGLKLGRIQDGDLAIMLGAGTGYSWVATAVKWGSN